MKLWKWLVIIASIALIAWLTLRVNNWAGEWKDLFFYLDDWKMWVIVFVGAMVIGKILQKLLIVEVKLLEGKYDRPRGRRY